MVNVKLLKLLRKLMNLQQPVWCLRSTAKCNFSINLLCLCLIKHWAFPGLSLTKLQIKCRQVTITLHAHRTKWTTLTAVNTAHQTVSLTCKWNLLNSIFIYTYHKFVHYCGCTQICSIQSIRLAGFLKCWSVEIEMCSNVKGKSSFVQEIRVKFLKGNAHFICIFLDWASL